MFGLLWRAFIIAFLGLTLTACGTRPKPMPELQEIYEIRGVAVTANAGISRALIRGIKLRLDKSIHDTIRPTPLPRAVMNIHIVNVTKIAGYDGTRTETEVSVAMTDVPSGQTLQVRNFLVYSFSIDDRDASDAAAEAVASRLRVEYALSQPVLRQAPATAQRMSTRMRDDTLVPIKAPDDKPVVIPLKTAPAIGADQDPMLNSKTKLAPEKQQAVAPDKKATSDNAVENGAKAKVVIKPKAADPAAAEPCVETMDKKC